MFKRENVASAVAEFFGTAVLTTVVLAVAKSQLGLPYFVGIAAGLTLMILVSMIGNTSGSHVNPAVTLSLWSVKKINTLKAVLFIVMQCAGALVAFRLFSYLTGSSTNVERIAYDPKLFIAEAVGAFVFIFGISSAVFQKYEGGRLAGAIGGSLFVGVLVASTSSAAILNPAIALSLVWGTPYFVAPIVGGVLAANIYSTLFAGEKFALQIKTTRIAGKSTKTKKKASNVKAKKVTKKPAKRK